MGMIGFDVENKGEFACMGACPTNRSYKCERKRNYSGSSGLSRWSREIVLVSRPTPLRGLDSGIA